jgi:hypothetical protein
VWQADHAAAVNILHRYGDPDITLHTPYRRVKQILQERTDRQTDQTADPGLQPGNQRRRANYPNRAYPHMGEQ